MAILPTLMNHPLTQALGQALLDFLWQGALVGLLLLAFQTLARGGSAAVRHAAACLAMLSMPVIFAATVLANLPSAGGATAMAQEPALPTAMRMVLPAHASLAPVIGLSGYAVCLWLAGVLALSMYTLAGWLRVRRLHRQSSEPVDPVWMEMLESAIERLKTRLEISQPVRLCVTLAGEVPAVIGFLRPVILLPLTAVTRLDEAQLRAILAHELAHIRRQDYLANLLQSVAETLLFYHPAVWWVGRQIRREREHCADDLAVAACGDVMTYAGALARLEELRSGFSNPALAATGGDLLERIRRLTGQRPRQPRLSRPLSAVLAAALVVLIGIAPALREVDAAPQNPPPAPLSPETLTPLPSEMPPAESRKPALATPQPQPSVTPGPTIRELHDAGIEQGSMLEVQRDVAALDERLRMEMDRLNQAMQEVNARKGAGQSELEQLNQALAQMNQRIAAVNAAQASANAAQANAAAQAGAAKAAASPSPRNVDRLISLFDKFEAASDLDDARMILSYLAESDNPKAAEKILSVARSDTHFDLRRAAISHLAEQKQSFDTLVSLFDHESNLNARRALLAEIAESDDPRVEDKLSSIAQSDPDPSVRRSAIALLAEHRPVEH